MEAMVKAGLNYWRHQGASPGAGSTSPSLEDAYAILNSTPRSTDQEVKYAYRRLMSQIPLELLYLVLVEGVQVQLVLVLVKLHVQGIFHIL